MRNIRNHPGTVICSTSKLLKSYKQKGYGNPRLLSLLSVINETINHVESQLPDKQLYHLHALHSALANKNKNICGNVSVSSYKYGFDNCLSPVFVPVRN